MTDGQHSAAAGVARPLRIAHLVYRFDCGGLQNGMVNIIRGLPAHLFEHTVISLTDSTEFRRRLPDNVPVVELHKPPGNNPAYLYRIWKMLRTGHFDVFHTRNLPCLEGQLAGFLAGVPARVHGEHGWDVSDLHGTARRYRLLRKAFRPLVGRYVVVSRQLQDYLDREIGIDPARVSRICNGVDATRFRPRQGGLPLEPFVVGSVGRLEEVKDYETLARAFALLAAESPVAPRLHLVGDGSRREAISAYLRGRGLLPLVELAGERADVPEQMQRFSVFVLPSRAEGISNTILEAMASGLPVVATAVGGNGELVAEGETGSLVPAQDPDRMAEALLCYASDAALRQTQGAAGRRRVEHGFSLDGMVARYTAMYDQLLQRAGVAPARS